MFDVAFENGLLNLARTFFEAAQAPARACPLTVASPLVVLYSAGREVTGFLADAGKDRCILANADDFALMRLLGGVEGSVISCGLGGKNSITASSIESERDMTSFLLCVQRGIYDLYRNFLEPGELVINIRGADIDINKAMLVSAAAVMCGAAHEKIKNMAFLPV